MHLNYNISWSTQLHNNRQQSVASTTLLLTMHVNKLPTPTSDGANQIIYYHHSHNTRHQIRSENFYFWELSPVYRFILLLSKYPPRENLPGKLCLTFEASFVVDHHSSRSNQRCHSVPQWLYILSPGRISSFQPNSNEMPSRSCIQAISRTTGTS